VEMPAGGAETRWRARLPRRPMFSGRPISPGRPWRSIRSLDSISSASFLVVRLIVD
jgi:hypothetical protein